MRKHVGGEQEAAEGRLSHVSKKGKMLQILSLEWREYNSLAGCGSQDGGYLEHCVEGISLSCGDLAPGSGRDRMCGQFRIWLDKYSPLDRMCRPMKRDQWGHTFYPLMSHLWMTDKVTSKANVSVANSLLIISSKMYIFRSDRFLSGLVWKRRGVHGT